MKAYKIRDRNTGLFSTGGVTPSWTKRGKTWNSEGALKSHLTLLQEYSTYSRKKWQCPDNWDVVVLTWEPAESSVYPARDLAEREPKK